MVKIQEHLEEMHKVRKDMKAAKGWRHECLLRQYNRMAKELKTAQTYLKLSKGKAATNEEGAAS